MLKRMATITSEDGKSVDIFLRDYEHNYEVALEDGEPCFGIFDTKEEAVAAVYAAWSRKWDLVWNTDFTVKGEQNEG